MEEKDGIDLEEMKTSCFAIAIDGTVDRVRRIADALKVAEGTELPDPSVEVEVAIRSGATVYRVYGSLKGELAQASLMEIVAGASLRMNREGWKNERW